MTDDQRADALACAGNPIIHTPNLDRLAEEGVRFTNAFVTTAICMTSRACVFTGQYARRHGIWRFNKNLTPEQLTNSYLGRLKAAGYRTGFIGKWGVGHPNSAEDLLDYNKGFAGQSRYFEGDVKQKKGKHLTARMGDQAIEFLEGCDSELPFHLSLSFKAPHCQDSSDIYSDPFPADPAFESLYENIFIPPPFTASASFHERLPAFLQNGMNRDRWAIRFRSPSRFQKSVKDYYRLISGVDAVVGRIRDELKRRNLHENTIILFTSDHGFFLGELGFAGKWTPHEVSIRIPLIVFDPAIPLSKRGRVQDEMALQIDFAPTLLHYAGLDISPKMQGKSLVPIIKNHSIVKWRNAFFYEHLFTANGKIAPTEGIRTHRWKYIRYLILGEEETGNARYEQLFDISVDPHETTNLANKSDYQTQLNALRGQWAAWRKRSE